MLPGMTRAILRVRASTEKSDQLWPVSASSRFDSKAIVAPSGDHVAPVSVAGSWGRCLVRARRCVPSTSIVKICSLEPLATFVNAISRPSR
jgi:hypothetical protein